MLAGVQIEPASLVVLPELFATGFDVEEEGIAEGAGQGLAETGTFLGQLARKFQCTVQGSGIALARSGKRLNLVVVYGPEGNLLATYQKMHPFTYAGEHKHFEAGTSLASYRASSFQVTPFICYDLRFPEVFRHAVLSGTQVFAVSANWPKVRSVHWFALLQARAIENQCFVIGVNRVGRDKHMEFFGGSVIYDPQGIQIALAGDEECVLQAELDVDALLRWRQGFPVLQDVKRELLGLVH